MDPLVSGPYPELADAVRSQLNSVMKAWEKIVRPMIPTATKISFSEFIDDVPDILSKMADALASSDPAEVALLMKRSPEQGIHRFEIHYDIKELVTEDRVLRRLIVEHVHDALDRPLTVKEVVALNWAIDIVGQQAVVAFVEHQSGQLRQAAEAELKYLSFLSHDLSGNLGNVTIWLQVLKNELMGDLRFGTQLKSLDAAQQAILDTMGGMGRLLQAERLRNPGTVAPKNTVVNLPLLVNNVIAPYTLQALENGVQLVAEVPADATPTSDADLIRLVLQNLVGNALKYGGGGGVRVRVRARRVKSRWTLSVIDQGPGIPTQHLDRIFEAFQRGNIYGQPGIGLGLAIASRAAKLLRAELSVVSKPGEGSTFSLRLPRS